MPLADDLRDLTRQSLAALDASHDYYFHSRVVWRLTAKLIGAGHQLSPRNAVTGSIVNPQDFVKLSRRYVREHVTTFTFQHFVSLFEEFFFDLLRLWLMAYPGSLSKRTIEFGTVMNAPDKTTIALVVIDKELNELKYERVAAWFEYLEKIARLGCPTLEQVEKIAEIKASRDILIHNKGVANAIYVTKAGRLARHRAGERLKLPQSYHRASWETIRTVVRELGEAVAAKA